MFPTLPPFALDTPSLRRALRKFGENDGQNITLIGDPCNDENTLCCRNCGWRFCAFTTRSSGK